MFAANRATGRRAVAPFVTAGDPDAATSVAVLEAVARAGASLCELGVPYSDPIADGPVIQTSYTRAIAAGISLEGVFGIARQATARLTMPILAMASYSLVFRRGIDRFVADAVTAGLAGFVIPDLPVEESDDFDAACRGAGLALVRLVTPTTPPARAAAIAAKSTGFLYCVSVAGVTGARTELPAGLVDRVQWLRNETDVPILVGFGISSPEQVRAVCRVADGAIVGSALVRLVAEQAGSGPAALSTAVERFVADLAKAAGG
ncbi:MAG: tryptophan synthase subunit alpha [Planctomycetes bacterium]|nr:tryptophan synthase subunit alpha [Planctomycetota bacterium]